MEAASLPREFSLQSNTGSQDSVPGRDSLLRRSRGSYADADDRRASVTTAMSPNDIDKKCQLIARFYTDDREGFADQVRQNLSIYLNTADKIRLKVTNSAIIITDRSIWQRKIDRIPISLINDVQIDALSPKIIYFLIADMLTAKRHEVLAFLCKQASDAHKIVTASQVRGRSLGIYKKHNDWLTGSPFDNRKSQTLEADHVLAKSTNPKQFSLGTSQSKDCNKGENEPIYQNIDGGPVVPMRQKTKKDLKARNASLERELGLKKDSFIRRSQRFRLSFGADKKKKKEKLPEQYRSSVLQYDSDNDLKQQPTEATEDKSCLQMNTNGIARIVVGGNEQDENENPRQTGDGAITPPGTTIHHQKPTDSPRQELVDDEQLTTNSNNQDDGFYDNVQGIVNDESSDPPDLPIRKFPIIKMDEPVVESHEITTSQHVVTSEVRRSSIQLGENGEQPKIIESKEPTEPEDKVVESSESEFELVLAGLQKLTQPKQIKGAWPEKTERRYPHQIQAAQALNEPKPPQAQKPVEPPANHLAKNSPQRKSVRRTGQYQSIREFEKMQQSCKNSLAGSFHESQPQAAISNFTVSPTSPITSSPAISRRKVNAVSNQRGAYHSYTHLSGNDSQSLGKKIMPSNLYEEKKATNSVKKPKRTSNISTHSAPQNIVLRRVNANTVKNEAPPIPERRSMSFDRGTKPVYSTTDNISQLHMVRPRENYSSLDRRSTKRNGNENAIPAQKRQSQHYYSSDMLTPNPGGQKARASLPVRGMPVIDGRMRRADGNCSLQPALMRIRKAEHYISLPNQPHIVQQNDLNFYQHQQMENNPGFQRFFESILKYGPVIKETSQTPQPDVVMDSLSNGAKKSQPHLESESDKESSIRSSASAYWPPELKQQAEPVDEFEETASWQFHVPDVKMKRKPMVSY